MEELVEKQLESNFRIMEQIRARVDQIVEDPKTAAARNPIIPMDANVPLSMTSIYQRSINLT